MCCQRTSCHRHTRSQPCLDAPALLQDQALWPMVSLILRAPTLWTCTFCNWDEIRCPMKSMQAGSASCWNQYVPEAGFQNWSLFHTGIYNYSVWFSFSDLSQNSRKCNFCPVRSILALISIFCGLEQMFYTISSYPLWTDNIKYFLLRLSTIALDWSDRRPYDLIQSLMFVLSGFQWSLVVLMLHWGAGTLNPTMSTKTAVKMTFLLYKWDTKQSYLQNLITGTSWEKRGIWNTCFLWFWFFFTMSAMIYRLQELLLFQFIIIALD